MSLSQEARKPVKLVLIVLICHQQVGEVLCVNVLDVTLLNFNLSYSECSNMLIEALMTRKYQEILLLSVTEIRAIIKLLTKYTVYILKIPINLYTVNTEIRNLVG